MHVNRFHATDCQQNIFSELIQNGSHTAFGKEHCFKNIKNYDDFKRHVPVRTYEAFKPYIQRIFNREKDVLWPGLPDYFGKTTGTTDASKYLPVTNAFLSCTQYAAKYMLCNLAMLKGHARFIGKKVFYLDDQQEFENINGFACGAISAIKSSRMPTWAKSFSFPGSCLNGLTEPAQRLNTIIDTIPVNDINMAVALPVWLSHFLNEFEKRKGRKFKAFFPQFSVLFLTGMNCEPYEQLIYEHMGGDLIILENYTATEGNFAYQPVPGVKGMELICNQGIFYEFIPLKEASSPQPARIQLKDVSLFQRYAIVISVCNGLWAYMMNDMVEFVSLNPYRLIICGRLNDIFSPFGEHMLPIQAEQAMAKTSTQANSIIRDFLIVPDFEASRYRCYIDFELAPTDIKTFQLLLDQNLCSKNSYYHDLSKASVINQPDIIPVSERFFHNIDVKHVTAQSKTKHLSQDQHIMRKAATLCGID